MTTNFSEVLFKELNFNKTREDVTFPIKYIGNVGEKSKAIGTKIKPETLLYNLNKIINKSDINRVDYTKGGYLPNLENGLEPLNDLFSDNILVYSPIPDKLMEMFKTSAGDKYNLNTEEDKEEEITKITNNSILKVVTPILPSITANIKTIFNACSIPIKKKDIKPIGVIQCKESFIHKPSKLVQLLKINLSCCTTSDVIELITNKINILVENNIFIHDIDFTRDFKGLFNKKELIEHLQSLTFPEEVEEEDPEIETPVKGFRYQGSETEGDATIISNNNTVGRNCLTFIKTIPNNGTIRYKFYNKFVQSMESPSVRSKIGSHINDWCNNPELILNRAINNSLDTGILRLEITFYRYDTNNILTEDFITKQMDWLQNLLTCKNGITSSAGKPKEIIYYNSIQNQFNNLCNNILYNVCILDVDNNLAFVSLYQNSLTGKTNGFYVKEANSIKLSNVLRYYTHNKPIILILLHVDKNNGLVSIQQDTYIKVNPNGEELVTYLTKGSDYLHGISVKDITTKQPKDVGLIPNSTFNFVIPNKVLCLNKTPTKTTSVTRFKNIDFSLLTYPDSNLTIRTVNKCIKEETTAEQFAEENKEKLEEINAKNKILAEEMEAQQKEIEEQLSLQKYMESNKRKIYTLLLSVRANTRKLIDLEDNTTLYIYAFKKINTTYGETLLLACSTDNTLKDNTELNLYWSVTNITKYLTNGINFYKQLDIHGITAYGGLTGLPILTVKKKGTYLSQTKKRCAAMEIVDKYCNKTEDTSILDTRITTKARNLLDICPEYVGIKGKNKLDTIVKEGDTVTILEYKEYKSSILVKARINEKDPDYFTTSYWLQQIIKDRIKQKDPNIFTVLAGPDKSAPNRHKCKTYLGLAVPTPKELTE